jgi:WD40 repeat protein
MDKSGQAYRVLDVVNGHSVTDVHLSPTGGYLLISAEQKQAIICDPQGNLVKECEFGDQYLTDPANTRGHTSFIRRCCWSPIDNGEEFLTCSDDGTARIWNSTTFQQKIVLKVSIQKTGAGPRRGVSSVCYSEDGTAIVVGVSDGSIQLWNAKKPLTPKIIFPHAHGDSTCDAFHDQTVTCVQFVNQYTLISRGVDGLLKVWDIRSAKKSRVGSAASSSSSAATSSTYSSSFSDLQPVFTHVVPNPNGLGDVCPGPSSVGLVAGACLPGSPIGFLSFFSADYSTPTVQYRLQLSSSPSAPSSFPPSSLYLFSLSEWDPNSRATPHPHQPDCIRLQRFPHPRTLQRGPLTEGRAALL